MARPALSAARAVEIIDLLAGVPSRSFTLTEIARATKINVASCHTILGVLVERGYLIRSADTKYTLGRALVAAGGAALHGNPLMAKAEAAARQLLRELDVPVLLTTAIGDEVVSLVSLANQAGLAPRMKVGERSPLVAPLGTPFLAWASDEEIDDWIARRTARKDEKLAAEWRHAIDVIRQRGFQVTLNFPQMPEDLVSIYRLSASGKPPDYKSRIFEVLKTLDHEGVQLETIEPDQYYDVELIDAPLFDQDGKTIFCLCIGGFPEKITGARITSLADRLIRSAVDIMRSDRTARRTEATTRRSETARN